MPGTVMLTAVGRDRVGIVAEVSDLLFDLGCNLLDSSMTLLRGEFAIILMVDLPEEQSIEALEKQLPELEKRMGLSMHVRRLSEDELKQAPEGGVPHMISVYGADRTGIVAGITRKLADLGINITDVETKSTGDEPNPIFVMLLEVSVPDSLPTRAVESALQEASEALGVDVSVQVLEVYEL